MVGGTGRLETRLEELVYRGKYGAGGQQRSDKGGNEGITREWRRQELDLETGWRMLRRRKLSL